MEKNSNEHDSSNEEETIDFCVLSLLIFVCTRGSQWSYMRQSESVQGTFLWIETCFTCIDMKKSFSPSYPESGNLHKKAYTKSSSRQAFDSLKSHIIR